MRAVLIVASDRVSSGEREDASAGLVADVLRAAEIELAEVRVVPDERPAIAEAIAAAAREAALVLTTGGTGLAPRDVTPEATRDVIEREVPGLGEAMRAAGMATVPTAALSRATAGSIGASLVVNLPGSPKGARDSLAAVMPAIKHGLTTLAGGTLDCAGSS